MRFLKKHAEYRRYTRSRAGNALYFFVLFAAGLFTVLPMIYCVLTSLKPLDELLVFPPRFFVQRPTLSNYAVLPSLLNKLRVPVSRYLFNSVFVAVTGTVCHIIAASMAAFVFSKSKIRGRKALFLIVQFTLLYNAYTLAVPQYLIFGKLHMIDSYLIYILPAIPSAMGCFLMKQYIDISIPVSLMEAARIDGASMAPYFLENRHAGCQACLDDARAFFLPGYVVNRAAGNHFQRAAQNAPAGYELDYRRWYRPFGQRHGGDRTADDTADYRIRHFTEQRDGNHEQFRY